MFYNRLLERIIMRKSVLAAAVAAAFVSPVAVTTANAQAAAAAPASPHTFTGNVAVVSDYRFRGISQTYLAPAIQGGFDYSHSSGFYVGNWNSSVSGNSYNNGAGVEMDFYGGWKGSWGDWGLDVGGLYYYYPEAYYTSGVANGRSKYNNFELYIGGSWKWLSAKYSYATTDYFGLNGTAINGFAQGVDKSNAAVPGVTTGSRTSDSKGSSYFEINAAYEVAPKWTVSGHVGALRVKNWGGFNYTDWKLGVTYDAGWATIGAAYVASNARAEFYNLAPAGGPAGTTKDTQKDTLVLSISKTF